MHMQYLHIYRDLSRLLVNAHLSYDVEKIWPLYVPPYFDMATGMFSHVKFQLYIIIDKIKTCIRWTKPLSACLRYSARFLEMWHFV